MTDPFEPDLSGEKTLSPNEEDIPVRIRAALSHAGSALAERLRAGDRLDDGWAEYLIAEVGYSLRGRGLRIAGGRVQKRI